MRPLLLSLAGFGIKETHRLPLKALAHSNVVLISAWRRRPPSFRWRRRRSSHNPLTLRDDLGAASSKPPLALLTSSCGLLLGRACNYEDDECAARQHSHTPTFHLHRAHPPTSLRLHSPKRLHRVKAAAIYFFLETKSLFSRR